VSPEYQLAQVNVARMRAPLDDPRMRGFVDGLAVVGGLAEAAPGFVWRLPGAQAHAPVVADEDGVASIVNVSVWHDYASLHDFTYRTAHAAYLKRRDRWFVPEEGHTVALWWVRAGERPGRDEALRRLRHLRTHGPTPRAFTTRRRFGPDGRRVERREPLPARGARSR